METPNETNKGLLVFAGRHVNVYKRGGSYHEERVIRVRKPKRDEWPTGKRNGRQKSFT